MPLSTGLGLCAAAAMVTALLVHARTDHPKDSRSGIPWILILHPVVLFIGFLAYQGATANDGPGLAGVAAWGLLWPVAVEIASAGHPYRVVRLLRLYAQYQWTAPLPFGAEYRRYRRKARPLRCTQRTLIALLLPVLVAGIVLTDLLAGTPA